MARGRGAGLLLVGYSYGALIVAGAAPEACAACHLRKHLECPLGCPQITTCQPQIGINNTNQCQIGKMMPFGNHLRTDDYIDIPVNDRLDKRFGGLWRADRIA